LSRAKWWAPDYRGPQLISFDAELAAPSASGLGDTLTVNVLGRDIDANDRLAAAHRMADAVDQLRVRVSRPAHSDKAPHTFLATVKATPEAEDTIFNVINRPVPQRHRHPHPRRHRDGVGRAGPISDWRRA